MICFNCQKETPDTELYCRNCGTKLDYTFQQVDAHLKNTIKMEKIQETQSFSLWLLSLMVFVFVCALVFLSFWPHPRETIFIPGYTPSLSTPNKTPSIYHPIILREERK